MRQGNQLCPGVAGFGALEAGQGPAQGLFAEAHARLDRPVVGVGVPNGGGNDGDVQRDSLRRQLGIPDGFRRFLPLQIDAGAFEVIDQFRHPAFM